MKNSLVSVDMEMAASKDKSFYRRLLTSYFKSIKHLFIQSEIDKIMGAVRQGNLSIASSDIVTLRLAQAKSDGKMSIIDFQQLYQFESMLKKLPIRGNNTSCMDVAYAKLLNGENQCRVTNMTMNSRINSEFALFDRVKMIIQDILGNVPTGFLDTEVFFGPGSTINDNKRTFEETSTFYKITDRLIVPERAKFYLAAHLSYNPNWVDMLGTHYRTQQNSDESRLSFEKRVFAKHFVVVPDDHPSGISFVPKTADEHRTIGVEMNGLVPLQKIVGDMIRSRLCRKTKIDLNSQQRNRHMARLAQTFKLATVDLANASSTISVELVRALLPTDWFALVSDFRSSHGKCNQLDSDIIEYEMISSMGNGFTFELESLIFYALARATCEQDGLRELEILKSTSVFGDDIIIPQRVANRLFKNLTLFGFTANESKSFTKGFFFESCGADYYNGTDVRPFFLRREILTLGDMFFLMNSLLFKAITQQRSDFVEVFSSLLKMIPRNCPCGPLHFETEHSGYTTVATDDLEAILRVPLEYAQARGGVKYSAELCAWTYKKWIKLGVESPLSQNTQYAVQHARYMTFLKGNYKGKVVLRGRVKTSPTCVTSSRWDGDLTVHELRVVKSLFQTF